MFIPHPSKRFTSYKRDVRNLVKNIFVRVILIEIWIKLLIIIQIIIIKN